MGSPRTTTYEGLDAAAGHGAGVLVAHDGGIADIPLPVGLDVTVGRDGGCGIRIDHPSVSRRHATLRWDGAHSIWIRDLGSHNGTRVGGEPLAHALALSSGAEVSLGPARLLLYVRGERRAPDAEIVTTDPAMRRALALSERAAWVDSTVLLVGETGTGKELLARRAHALGKRAAGPFLALNCGALPEAIAASELFGHERGAFTGATSGRAGAFERAAGGTLFLDEIGELPPRIQVMLLRVLQERAVVRIGGSRLIGLDVRVMCATNRDLDEMVRRGTFREDLLFRLDVLRIQLPPLRSRASDVELLARRFLAEQAPGLVLCDEAAALLRAHHWPGNVRELRNVIERALLLEPEGPSARGLREVLGSPESARDRDLGSRLGQVERDEIERALEACGGNQSRAAEWLGITRRALTYRLGKHRLGRP